MNQNILTKTIELPSKGLNLYPVDNPLSSGEIELRYPTTRDEDILSDSSLIKNNTVIDKFIENIVINPDVKKEFQNGNVYSFDKDAVGLYSRILAYGSDYSPGIVCPFCSEHHQSGKYNINLLDIKPKDLSAIDFSKSLSVELPLSKKIVEFRFQMIKDEREILIAEKRLKELKVKSGYGPITTILKNSITSVDGNCDKAFLNSFVEDMLSRDSLFLRNYISESTPGMDFRFFFECESCGESDYITVPMTSSFFWPQFG